MSRPRVLVTGSSGCVGQAVVEALLPFAEVTGYDRIPPRGIAPTQFFQGQLTDPVLLLQAMSSVDCILHLAAAPDDEPTPDRMQAYPADSDNFLSDLVPSNITGVYHILKLAVRANVRRVVLTSSGQVIARHLTDASCRVNADSALAPRYMYASTKVFLESMGRVFAREHGLEVLIARLGWCPRPGQESEIQAYNLAPNCYLSPQDAGQFYAATVRSLRWPSTTDADGKSFTYGVAYVTSRPVDGNEVYDLSVARQLGYEPSRTYDWTEWLNRHKK